MSRESVDAATVALLLDTLCLTPAITSEAARTRWHSANADAVLPLVRFEGAELWLFRRWRELGVTPSASAQAELRSLAHRANLDNMRIDAQLERVTTMLDEAGLHWALIKGQARRAASRLYPYATVRTSSDVDVLVPDDEADRAWQHLCAHGFRPLSQEPVDWRADHHRPTLIDSQNVCVELHVTTALSVTPAEAWARATIDADVVVWNDRPVLVPSATELLWQSLAHTVSDGTRGYTLRAFLSTAAILAAGRAIDWSRVAARIAASEVRYNGENRVVPRDRVLSTLTTCAELAGVALPAEFTPPVIRPLAPLLFWRARVLHYVSRRDVRERLLEEALRVEAGLPVTPAVHRAQPFRNLRRRSTSVVARALYRSWRAWQ